MPVKILSCDMHRLVSNKKWADSNRKAQCSSQAVRFLHDERRGGTCKFCRTFPGNVVVGVQVAICTPSTTDRQYLTVEAAEISNKLLQGIPMFVKHKMIGFDKHN